MKRALHEAKARKLAYAELPIGTLFQVSERLADMLDSQDTELANLRAENERLHRVPLCADHAQTWFTARDLIKAECWICELVARAETAEGQRDAVSTILDEKFHAGSRVINCVAHSQLPLTKRPEDCRLCLTDLRNQLSLAIRMNEFLNDKVDRISQALAQSKARRREDAK